MPDFVPGLELSKFFFLEAVKSVLETIAPRLQYSAAMIGDGSEILGFDTEMSADHHWGPRLMLFLTEVDHRSLRKPIDDALSHQYQCDSGLGVPLNF